MIDNQKKELLEELAGLDTGKAQPLYHPYPVINIFREDNPFAAESMVEKREEDKLLLNMGGLICDSSDNVRPQIAALLEREGAVEKENPDFVIAMDKDGSFLKYAIVQGCTALKATYGLVSRYGMDTDGPSLAQPAVGAKTADMIARVLQAVACVDKKDPMSRDAYIYEYMEALENTDMSGMKIAIPKDLSSMGLNEIQLACYNQMLDVFEAKGAEIDTVELDWVSYGTVVHEIIASSEQRMCADEIGLSLIEEEEGLSYGNYLLEEDHYEAYYLKALKLRSLIKDSCDMLFRNYALLVVPFTQEKDCYSLCANLAGLPAMAVSYAPYGATTEDGSPITEGIFMIAGANYENHLIKAAYAYEQEV